MAEWHISSARVSRQADVTGIYQEQSWTTRSSGTAEPLWRFPEFGGKRPSTSRLSMVIGQTRSRTAPAKNGFVQLRNKLLRTPPSLHALALLEHSHRFFETATHQIERSGQSRDLIAAVRGQFGNAEVALADRFRRRGHGSHRPDDHEI